MRGDDDQAVLELAVAATIIYGGRFRLTMMAVDARHERTEHRRQGVDLLVMGSRGQGPRRSVVLGATPSAVIAAAPCPATVVPRPAIAGTL